jgi:hypothetical protein
LPESLRRADQPRFKLVQLVFGHVGYQPTYVDNRLAETLSARSLGIDQR